MVLPKHVIDALDRIPITELEHYLDERKGSKVLLEAPIYVKASILKRLSNEQLNDRLAEICLVTMGGHGDHFLVQERFEIQRILKRRSNPCGLEA